MGQYIVYLPRITIGLVPKERSLVPTAGSKKYWTGDYHPIDLRDLSDLIPLGMLTPGQRVNTAAVVAAATALVFAYQGKNVPREVDTPILKDMVRYLERYIPRKFFDGRDETRMEMFLHGLRRFILHIRPTKLVHLDEDLRQHDHRTPVIKIEDTENTDPLLHDDSDMDYLEHPRDPPKSRKRGLDDSEERPTKRARPGQTLSRRHENFLSSQFHPTSETDGMRQMLEVAGLGGADIDRCLRFMAQGMSAKRAIDEIGKGLRLPV